MAVAHALRLEPRNGHVASAKLSKPRKRAAGSISNRSRKPRASSGPIPAFAPARSTLESKCRNQRTTSNFMNLVELFEFDI
jgi:hypothetical protein